MTDMALRVPLAAGGAVLEATGNALQWGFARYMRAPLGNTGVLVLVTLTALAGSNALYFQSQQHPSPLFAPVVTAAAPTPEPIPVVPADRPQATASVSPPAAEVTGSVEARPAAASAAPSTPTLGNAEVLEIQRKLAAMELYAGALDGLYGPRTAAAIRAFETANGMRPLGELSVELLEAVRKADAIPPAVVAPQATPTPVPPSDIDSAFKPEPDRPKVVNELAPLTPPVPLAETLAAPQQSAAGAESVESIIAGVQTVPMTTPPTATQAAADSDPAPETTGSLGPQDAAPANAAIPVLNTEASPEEVAPFSAVEPSTIAKVQRGLASLGFLHGPADGVFGEATAKAIRNFEVYYSYNVTGQITPELVDLLVRYGAAI